MTAARRFASSPPPGHPAGLDPGEVTLATDGPIDGGGAGRPPVGAAVAVSVVNMVSRLTGFVRVVATGAALGIAALGDTYQSASVVSNVLFELLAGGLLFAVLVPAFVTRRADGDQAGARALAGVLVARAVVVLGAIVAVLLVASPWVARALLAAAPESTRDQQVAVATVLLWFVLPQVVLYAVGAVVTALLQASHRFLAAAAAPIANNVVVTATMVVFAGLHGTGGGLMLTTGEKVVLGGGTLLGTMALSGVVLIEAIRADDTAPRIRWRDPAAGPLGPLARRGLWGAGHVGLNQLLILATVVVASRVAGGAIATTTALTFFLLPHAVLAHPVATTLSPRLAALGHAGDEAGFTAELGRGVRFLLVVLLPASALLAALARPGLQVLSGVGGFDERGVGLVAASLAGLATALAGYSSLHLLTRAAYALDDARTPTVIMGVATAAAVAAMAALAGIAEGRALLAGLGLVHGVAFTAAAVALGRRVQHRSGPVGGLGAALARGAGAALAGGAAAWAASAAVGSDGRASAVVGGAAGLALGSGAVIVVLRLTGAPELEQVRGQLSTVARRLARRSGRGSG